MRHDFAQTVLRKVRSDYQLIAQDYSASRSNIWPEFHDFLTRVKPGDKVLDIGCGNGRLTKIFEGVKVDYTGLDVSSRILEQGQQLFPQYHFAQGDILNIPFPKQTFDCVFCVAVLHHIPSKELRRLAVSNMHDVLKPGGWLLINVWNLWRQPHIGRIRRNNWKHFFGMSPYDRNDILVPWRSSGVEQYYHAFTERELKSLLQRNGFRIEHAWSSRGTAAPVAKQSDNIVVIAQRI